MSKFTFFFRKIYLRLRGPEFKTGQVIPYYGGATSIVSSKWEKNHWSYTLAHCTPDMWFSENLIIYYIDNPVKDGRSYGYRNKR